MPCCPRPEINYAFILIDGTFKIKPKFLFLFLTALLDQCVECQKSECDRWSALLCRTQFGWEGYQTL